MIYAVAASSFGGVKKNLTADHFNPYRKGQKRSMAGYFSDLKAMKRAQDERAQANGEPHGG